MMNVTAFCPRNPKVRFSYPLTKLCFVAVIGQVLVEPTQPIPDGPPHEEGKPPHHRQINNWFPLMARRIHLRKTPNLLIRPVVTAMLRPPNALCRGGVAG